MARITNEKIKKVVPFDEALTMTGYGRFNLFILIVSGGCLMCVIIETMSMMFIIPAAQCDLKLGLSEKGLLSSTSFFGVAASSHMWGFIADTRGRRNVLIISLFLSALISIISSIVPWSWLFILLRFLNGFFIGGSSAIVYAYAGEFHDNRYRPKIVSWIATFVAFGNMYLPGFAWIILPEKWKYEVPYLNIFFRPWRLLVIINALPSIIFAICICFLPESPKFLLTRGKYEEVLNHLKGMFSINTGQNKDDYLVSGILWDELSETNPKKPSCFLQTVWKQTIPLFKPPFILKTIMACTLQFGIFLTTSGIIMWYPEILNTMSHYITEVSNESVSLCNAISYDEFQHNDTEIKPVYVCKDTVKTEVFFISLMIGLCYVVCYVFIGSVINIFGKKNLLAGFITVTGISGLIAQFMYGYTYIQILIALFVLGAAGIGIVNAIVVDLYPTQIRAMALAISLMCGRFGAMAGSNIVGPLLYNFCNFMFCIFAAEHLLLVIIVIFLPSKPHIPKLTEPVI